MRFGFLVIAALFTLLLPHRGFAAVVDIGAVYYSDTFANGTSTSTYTRAFYDIFIATALTREGNLLIGWDYSALAATDNPGTAETLSVSKMGPKLLWYIGRAKLFRLGVAYNLVTTGAYSQGTTSYTWKGSAISSDIGTNVFLTDSVSFSLRINYVLATFVDQFVGSTYSQVSVKRTYMYPSIGLSYFF